MRCRRFPLEQKIRFLDAYEQIGVVTIAARQTGVPREACRRWIRQKEQLREDYELSLLPINQDVNVDVKPYKKYSLKVKINCIQDVEAGMSIRETAQEHDCDEKSVRNWIKTQDTLLALYYTQNNVIEDGRSPNGFVPTPFSVGGYNMAKDELDNDFSKKIKAQAKEIAYLKDKITFLENLNKILENRTGQVKKKINSQQLNKASNQEEKM